MSSLLAALLRSPPPALGVAQPVLLLPSSSQPKMIQHAKGGKEIPIPGIVRVPTYSTDYLPVRRERNTYIRPKGATRGAEARAQLLAQPARLWAGHGAAA